MLEPLFFSKSDADICTADGMMEDDSAILMESREDVSGYPGLITERNRNGTDPEGPDAGRVKYVYL